MASHTVRNQTGLQKHVGSGGPTYEKTKNSERECSTSSYLQTLISWLCREVYAIISDPHPHTHTHTLAQNLPAEQPLNKPAHDHFVFISVCARERFFFCLRFWWNDGIQTIRRKGRWTPEGTITTLTARGSLIVNILHMRPVMTNSWASALTQLCRAGCEVRPGCWQVAQPAKKSLELVLDLKKKGNVWITYLLVYKGSIFLIYK